MRKDNLRDDDENKTIHKPISEHTNGSNSEHCRRDRNIKLPGLVALGNRD